MPRRTQAKGRRLACPFHHARKAGCHYPLSPAPRFRARSAAQLGANPREAGTKMLDSYHFDRTTARYAACASVPVILCLYAAAMRLFGDGFLPFGAVSALVGVFTSYAMLAPAPGEIATGYLDFNTDPRIRPLFGVAYSALGALLLRGMCVHEAAATGMAAEVTSAIVLAGNVAAAVVPLPMAYVVVITTIATIADETQAVTGPATDDQPQLAPWQLAMLDHRQDVSPRRPARSSVRGL